jgi:hypothetical protein
MMYEDDPVVPFMMFFFFQFCDDIEDGNSGLDFSLATEGRMLGESSYLTFVSLSPKPAKVVVIESIAQRTFFKSGGTTVQIFVVLYTLARVRSHDSS